MRTIRVHSSVQLAWIIANSEACFAGSEMIQPVHLFFALLKIIDEAFHQDADRAGLTSDEILEVTAMAASGRQLIGMPGEEITRLRRSMANALREDKTKPLVAKKLHRSPECIKLFDRASELAIQEKEPFLKLLHLLKAILIDAPLDVAKYLPPPATQKPVLTWESRINDFVTQFQLTRITLMLTDMENSTSIKQRYGDIESAKIFRAHDNLVREHLARFQQAREIKTIGDSFLLSFAAELDAVRFALILQSELREHKYLSRIPIKVRIGINSGEILSKIVEGSSLSDPIFGITIDITSRIASLAVGGQILAAREIFERSLAESAEWLPAGLGQVQWVSHGLYKLKGFSTPVEIFEVGEVGKAAFLKPSTNEKATQIKEKSTSQIETVKSSARPTSSMKTSSPLPPLRAGFARGIERDLTELARQGRLKTIIGRKPEMKALARYLQRASKRKVLLVGASGVGKRSIVEGLAQQSIMNRAPAALRSMRIVQLDTAQLVSLTAPRVDLQAPLKEVVREAAKDPNLIIFCDDIHLIFEERLAGGLPEVIDILRNILVSENSPCIGTTTPEHFDRHIKGDPLIMRSFHVLQIREPAVEEAIEICSEHAHRIEGVQNVVFTEDAIAGAVLLSSSLLQGQSLPEKAIDVLENAAAFAKVSSLTLDNEVPVKGVPRVGRKLIEKVLQEYYGLSVIDNLMATKMSLD